MASKNWTKADEKFFFSDIRPATRKSRELKAEIRKRFPPPNAAEVKRWNRDRGTDIMDTIEAYAERTGIPRYAASRILQIGWETSKEKLKLGAIMAKRRKKGTSGLGLSVTSRKASRKRNWSSVNSGKAPMNRVPRACALVQSGEKKGKLRKGCKLTKNGAYCDELTRLPAQAKGRKLKSGRRVMVDCA